MYALCWPEERKHDPVFLPFLDLLTISMASSSAFPMSTSLVVDRFQEGGLLVVSCQVRGLGRLDLGQPRPELRISSASYLGDFVERYGKYKMEKASLDCYDRDLRRGVQLEALRREYQWVLSLSNGPPGDTQGVLSK